MSTTEHSCPKGIAAELYNVAKANDALDAIGGSTSWRWQEGLISRMPKATTVAAVLTKSFGTNDPMDWLAQVSDSLKPFISNTFGLESQRILKSGVTINSIYDSLVIVSVTTGSGATREDLIYKLCALKYASSLDDDDYYELANEEFVLNMYSSWAEKKLDKIILNNSYSFVDGKYLAGEGHITFSSEKHVRFCLEITNLRNKLVGYSSHFDMWRISWYELTDKQHVDIERKMIKFHSEIEAYIRNNYAKSDNQDTTSKKRCYSNVSITLPTRGEGLQWKD